MHVYIVYNIEDSIDIRIILMYDSKINAFTVRQLRAKFGFCAKLRVSLPSWKSDVQALKANFIWSTETLRHSQHAPSTNQLQVT